MACHCLSDLKKGIKKQDQEMQKIIKEVTVNGAYVLLKKEFGDDKMKKNLTKTIQFLIQIMCNNQDDDDQDDIKPKVKTLNKSIQVTPKDDNIKEKIKSSNKGVQTSPKKQPYPLKDEEKIKMNNQEIQASPKEPLKPLKEEENEPAESNGLSREKKKDEICFAYKFDKCSNGNECQKRHPQKCQKFCDFGHKNFDERGCETKDCKLLHTLSKRKKVLKIISLSQRTIIIFK